MSSACASARAAAATAQQPNEGHANKRLTTSRSPDTSLMAMSHEQRGSRATGCYPPRSRMTHTPITNEVTLNRNITPECSCSSGGHSHVSRDRSCVHEGVTTRRALRRAHVSRTPASVVARAATAVTRARLPAGGVSLSALRVTRHEC